MRSSFWIAALAGSFLLAFTATEAIHTANRYLQLQSYRAGQCTITAEQPYIPKSFFSPPQIPYFHFIVQTANGHTYRAQGTGSESEPLITDRLSVGKAYPCWYNPANPSEALLKRSFDWMYLTETILVFLLGIVIILAVRTYATQITECPTGLNPSNT